MSVFVRYWRGDWVADISSKENGKRKRLIESFGPGLKAKAAAEKGSGKPLSPRTVAKILTLDGTVFRYGKRIKTTPRTRWPLWRGSPTWETNGSVKDEETELSPCSNGSWVGIEVSSM